jgi:hypothetical protein
VRSVVVVSIYDPDVGGGGGGGGGTAVVPPLDDVEPEKDPAPDDVVGT